MSNLSTISTVSGIITTVLKKYCPPAAIASSMFSNPASLATAIEANKTDGHLFGWAINTSAISYAASLNGTIALWGVGATGAVVGGPAVIALTLGLTAIALLSQDSTQEKLNDILNDPNLLNGNIDILLKDQFGIDVHDIANDVLKEICNLPGPLGYLNDFGSWLGGELYDLLNPKLGKVRISS